MTILKPGLRPLVATLALLILAGCATQMTGGPRSRSKSPADAAAQAAVAGHYAKAAHDYLQAASQAGNASLRQQYRLEAGLDAAQAGEVSTAKPILSKINPAHLGQTDQARYNLAMREISIAKLPPDQALAQLPLPAPNTAPSVAERVWAKRADLHFAAHEPVKGIQSLVHRDAWLQSSRALKANDQQIYKQASKAIGLGIGPDSDAAANAGKTTRGWLALAQIGQSQFNSTKARNKALAEWQKKYPGHPANRSVLTDQFGYQNTQPVNRQKPGTVALATNGPPKARTEKVAIALPLKGKYQNAAQAIRDGFMFAYQNKNAGMPKPIVYDSSQMSAQQLAYKAASDKVGVLVGPLAKAKVAAMAGISLPMPEVALNSLDNAQPGSGFYQFGLSPEDEARSAALHAEKAGYSHALALVPNNGWGKRVLNTFRNTLQAAGGQIVHAQTYDEQSHDHSQAIQALLTKYKKGNDSNIDFIFVAAQPMQARLIRSQLKYYRAGGLPMVSTSQAYAGKKNPAQDIDLNGVHFVDMPWLLADGGTVKRLRAEAAQAYGSQETDYPRLFALGMDAWLLARRIDHNKLSPGHPIEGMTGVLSLQPDGNIRRYLGWAVFRNGLAKTLSLPSPRQARLESKKSRASNSDHAGGQMSSPVSASSKTQSAG